MFDWTLTEKVRLYCIYFFRGIFEGFYEFDLIKYVPIEHTFVDGTLYYLMSNRDFQFLIVKTEITAEQGEIFTNIGGSEYMKAFVALFTKLSPKRREEALELALSCPPYYSFEEIISLWNTIDRTNIKYAVIEELINAAAHYSAIPYLVTNKRCVGAFFVGPQLVKEVVDIEDEREVALEAASLAVEHTKVDLGIGIVHFKERTIVCLMKSREGLELCHFHHEGILDPEEQIPRITVIYIAKM